MNEKRLIRLLESIRKGEASVEEGVERLRTLPFEDLEHACIDHHRSLRKGFPEVVYGPGKSPRQLVEIVQSLKLQGGPVLVTRVDKDVADHVIQEVSGVVYHAVPRALSWIDEENRPAPSCKGEVAVVTAGTADLPVAEEACLTLDLMGHPFVRVFDVGVAGAHRLFQRLDKIREASVVIAVAGMDGVLPSLLGGIVDVVVVAVPTSSGYGANFQGVAPLLTMLNSCAPGVSVVNIDNGFGAGAIAALTNRR